MLDHLGSILSYKQAILVSQTRGSFVVVVPVMKPLPIVNMRSADCDALRDWVSSYGAAVRQQTVCQETTMTRHGPDEFDESSDEEVVEDGRGDNTLLQGEIGSSATFLLGARTRFRRVMRFNNRLLSRLLPNGRPVAWGA